jgi:hypothetical protein
VSLSDPKRPGRNDRAFVRQLAADLLFPINLMAMVPSGVSLGVAVAMVAVMIPIVVVIVVTMVV